MTFLILVLIIVLAAVVWHGQANKPKTGLAIDGAADTPEIAAEEDGWEGSFWEVADPKPASSLLHIAYVDAAGGRTKRSILVRSYTDDAEGLLIAHCLLRKETRTFRMDRISQAIDPETGEIVTDVPRWLCAKYKSSPAGLADDLLAEHIDVLKVLLYVAMTDGKLHPAEIIEIAQHASVITGNTAMSKEVVEAALERLDSPTLKGFKMAFGRLITKSDTTARMTIASAKRLASSDGALHDMEREALGYLEMRILRT